MRKTLMTSLVLAFSFSALGGTALAQAEPEPNPSPTPTANQLVGTSDETLAFAEPWWRKITPDKGPAGREDHTWTVDTEGRYAYLFGGRDGDVYGGRTGTTRTYAYCEQFGQDVRLVVRFHGNVATSRDRTANNARFDGINDGIRGHHTRNRDIDGHAARTASRNAHGNTES